MGKASNKKMKMTELGLLPEDWDVRTVRECTDVVTGATPSTTVKEFWGGDIPWMSSGELNKKYIHEVDGRITKKGYENCGTHMIPANCVLIGLAGQGKTRGTAAYNYIPLCTNQSIGSILPKPEFDPLFLYHYFDSQYNQLRLLSAGDGGRGGLNKQLLLNVQFPFPYISEQKKIGQVLTDTDNLISGLEKVIEKKKLIKLGTMQQLLSGRIRLKGFSKPWIELELGEIGKLTGAGVDKTINIDEKPVRLLNFLDVYNRDRIYNHELKMWVTASDYKIARCDVKQGDIFLTPSSELSNDIGRSAVAMSDMEGVCYSYHVLRLRPTIDLDMTFSAYMLKTAEYEEQIRFLSEGSGKRYVISLRNFREIRISIPDDIREQNAIGNVIAAMDNEIRDLEAERDKYKNIKQGMMQKLLTGQIRLPV